MKNLFKLQLREVKGIPQVTHLSKRELRFKLPSPLSGPPFSCAECAVTLFQPSLQGASALPESQQCSCFLVQISEGYFVLLIANIEMIVLSLFLVGQAEACDMKLSKVHFLLSVLYSTWSVVGPCSG